MNQILEIRNVSKAFSGIKALTSININIHQNNIIALLGPNGAGKTTLFNIINGNLIPDTGTVSFQGSNITGLPLYQIARLGIGRVFQQPRVFGNLTVLQNILISIDYYDGLMHSLKFGNQSKIKLKNKEIKAKNILDLCGLINYQNTLASNLSFGHQRILSIARVISSQARLLLLDEPTSGLHPSEIDHQIKLIQNLVAKNNYTIVLIEHNVDVVKRLSDNIYFLCDGKIIVNGTFEDILQNRVVQEVYLGK